MRNSASICWDRFNLSGAGPSGILEECNESLSSNGIACAHRSCTMGTSLAHAQATRTWVSGVGDDANPCSRTARCKTFAGAISKTAAGGEISVLDPGGFGGVTITKSITLTETARSSFWCSVRTRHHQRPGRHRDTSQHLIDRPAGTGSIGVHWLNGDALILDHVSISGLKPCPDQRQRHHDGFDDLAESRLRCRCAWRFHHGGEQHAGEQRRGVQSEPGAVVRLSNNGVYNNLTGFGCGGGTLASAGNNRKGNNTGGVWPPARQTPRLPCNRT